MVSRGPLARMIRDGWSGRRAATGGELSRAPLFARRWARGRARRCPRRAGEPTEQQGVACPLRSTAPARTDAGYRRWVEASPAADAPAARELSPSEAQICRAAC